MSLKGVLIIVLLFCLTACSGSNSGTNSGPRFELHKQAAQSLSDFQGQWLLINYWASWCKPCIEEIPELNALDQHADVQLLAFNFDQLKGETLQAEASRLAIAFPLLLSPPAPLFEQARPSALPATMIIDPQGNFRDWLMGPQTEAGIAARLAQYAQ